MILQTLYWTEKFQRLLSILTELRLKKENRNYFEWYFKSNLRALCREGAYGIRIRIANDCTEAQNASFQGGALYEKAPSAADSDKLKRLAAICYDADIRIKSTPLDSYGVLDRLTVEAAMRG